MWVLKKERTLKELKNLDLRSSGYPHYIYPIDYAFTFELPENFNRIASQIYLLQIPKENAPLCEIRINGSDPVFVWSGSYSIPLIHLQSGLNSAKVTLYPYPINLFESPGKPLGFQSNFKIYMLFPNTSLV
jgi:hypothetical protein